MWSTIDWSRPWYASVRAAAACVQNAGEAGILDGFNAHALAAGIANQRGLPLRFVAQAALPPGMAYEAYIDASGCVPTRANLHDFFNALVWLTFPRIKRQLNALQAAQIAQDGIGKSRGAARDGATIFDENAALLVLRDGPAGASLAAALRAHDWQGALVERRAAFELDAQVWLFGHALMEKLAAPYKAITAHVQIVWAPDSFFALGEEERCAWLDQTVARQLAQQGVRTADFTPLPVLGVPAWWPLQDETFYADLSVFRPKRQSVAK